MTIPANRLISALFQGLNFVPILGESRSHFVSASRTNSTFGSPWEPKLPGLYVFPEINLATYFEARVAFLKIAGIYARE